MMTSWSVLANAQTVEVKRQLPNGDYVLTIDGKDYLGIPPEKARKVNDSLDELDRLRQVKPLYDQLVGELREALALAKQQRDTAEEQTRIQKQIAENWKTLYEGEHILREKALGLAKKGKISTVLDKWWVRLPISLAPTLVSAFKK